jgi:hypothetical protein
MRGRSISQEEVHMSLKTRFATLLKYLLVVVVYFVADIVSGMLVPISINWSPTPEELPWVFGGMLLSAAVNTLVIALIVARSEWSGWRLFGAVAVAWYGTMTIMAQIEAYWFGPSLGLARDVPIALALKEALLVLAVTLAAVFAWGRARPSPRLADARERLPSSSAEWLWKLAIIAVAYLGLYFGFGFVVAWQNPALRDMYDNGADPVVFNPAYLLPLQIVRSALWVLFALPVIRMSRGSAWQIALLVGLLFALPMNIGHFIPNPIMPDASVRLSHFIETTTSNFIYGLFVTWLLSWRPNAVAIGSVRAAKP